MVRKVILKMSIVLVFLIILSSCGNSSTLTDAENRKKIDFIVMSDKGDYWNTMRAGANQAANEFNINLNFTGPENITNSDAQIKLIEDAISKKTDALIIAVSDYGLLAPEIEKAYKNRIPVFIVESGVDTKYISGYIGTDNKAAGNEAGKQLVAIAGKNSRVAIINFISGAKSGMDREKGVIEELNKHPGITVIDKQYCLSDEDTADYIVKQDIILDKVDAVVALNSDAAVGAAEAIDELGLTGKVKLIAFDITEREVQSIEKGVIQASIVQKPYNIGYLGVKYAAMSARNEKTPQNSNTGFVVINKDNMYSEENQKIIFPFTK